MNIQNLHFQIIQLQFYMKSISILIGYFEKYTPFEFFSVKCDRYTNHTDRRYVCCFEIIGLTFQIHTSQYICRTSTIFPIFQIQINQFKGFYQFLKNDFFIHGHVRHHMKRSLYHCATTVTRSKKPS